MYESYRAFAALGPKPRKAAARAELKKLVTWFNKADADAGWVIETEEREDVFRVVEEIAFVARHRGLVMEANDWREF